MKPTTFHVHDTAVQIWAEGLFPDRSLFNDIGNLLRRLGFSWHECARTVRHYTSLRDDTRRGKRGDLQFRAQQSGRHIEVLFYQELVTVNPNGGEYDFGRLANMPYLVRLRFQYTIRELSRLLTSRGLEYRNEAEPRTAAEQMLQKQAKLAAFQGPTFYTAPNASWRSVTNRRDADGVLLEPGQVRWFRTFNGRLQRGVVHPNINNMWWVIAGPRDLRNVAAFELFSYQPGVHPRKQVQPHRAARKLHEVMQRAIAAKNFERAIPVRDALLRMGVTP